MKFRTEISPLPRKGLIDHSTPMVLIGSCFTTEVGSRLKSGLFDVTINPFGPLYNPASIANNIERAAAMHTFDTQDIVEQGGAYHTFAGHSSVSATDIEETLRRHNEALKALNAGIRNAGWLIMTLGSAWVFRLKTDRTIVANCHKLPATMFCRELLSVDECTAYLQRAINAARSINPAIKIMLTVSPIRHGPDGLHGNQISKASLLLACEAIEEAVYFPSYEILMDDLRDYRFYAADMRHPSDTAVDYVYSLFEASFFKDETIAMAREARDLTKRFSHRIMSDNIDEIDALNRRNEEAARRLAERYPILKNIIQKELCHSI